MLNTTTRLLKECLASTEHRRLSKEAKQVAVQTGTIGSRRPTRSAMHASETQLCQQSRRTVNSVITNPGSQFGEPIMAVAFVEIHKHAAYTHQQSSRAHVTIRYCKALGSE
jgi:hypothetical protein